MILGIDPRSRQAAWGMHSDSSLGVPMRIGVDHSTSSYFITGSNRSYLTVWDLRFLLPVSSWRNPARFPVEALELSTGSALGIASAGPVAVAACGENEVSGWDIGRSRCVFATGCTDNVGALKESVMDTSKVAEDPVGLARQLGALELRSLAIRRTSLRSLELLDVDGKISVLSGGVDKTIRVWNPRAAKGECMHVMSSTHHRDTITSLRRIRGINHLLASGSADGVLNVWK